MIVRVGCSCGECPEWTIIEMQGELDVTMPEACAEGFDVGKICVKGGGKVQLTIGHHRLEGSVVQLPKPLLVMAQVLAQQGGATEYDAVGVVRQKVVFKDRPFALISAPAAR
ncbi:unnamed protein product [Pedinophyceae sp. YPF-701]|nr:unnamed protein product [Pedinophyceae sp. YPF-701]